MDGYGRARREGSRPDPYREWGASGQETGLEEGVWQLRLGAEGESGYPERPEEPNCIYYLRTGFCGYGSRCRFNHPRDRAAVLGAARGGGGEFPERAGQPVCQYYIRTGGCKFGASCKYHHPKEGGGGGGSSSSVQLNYYGYPLRPGEKECTYYLKTGQCKFADTCKFHHPMPANVQIMVQPPESQVVPGPPHLPPSVVYSPVQSPAGPSSQQYGIVVRPSLFPGFVSAPYGPFMLSHGVYPSWGPYPAPATPIASPGTQLTVGSGTMYGLAQLSPSSPGYTNAYLPAPASVGPSSSTQKENPFPERHGQPECQYYMKTGDCKYGSSCRYHHPPELITPTTNVVLSPMGLPLRPDAPPCMHYAQRGQCKFGAACRFDHPMGTLSYSPSASSLTDMPVAPYPVGSSMGTLAPSSSSSDLRPELVSGSTMGSGLTRMSSSTNTQLTSISSSLAASPLTKSENVPQLSVHQPNQGAAPSSSSSSNLESHCAS